jgi:hypothetical protein
MIALLDFKYTLQCVEGKKKKQNSIIASFYLLLSIIAALNAYNGALN